MKIASAYGQGAVLLCTGVAAYIMQDLIMKVASGSYPIHQALVFRAMTALPIAALIIYLTGSLKSLRGSTLPMLPLSLMIVFCNLAYYLGLATLPLATVGALYLSAPLMITALSVMLLKEKVTYGQWAAVAAAFAGVILIIHPGDGAFEWALLLPLLSALAYAGAVIIERKKSDSGNPSVMALHSQVWMALTGVTLGLLLGFGELNSEMQQHPSMDFLLRGWQWPSARDFTILLICGIVGSASTFFMTKAYTLSKASALAPFEYTALLWSILLGWLVFGHLPEAKEWAGIALLVGAGLVSIYAADTTQAAAPAESTAGDGVSS